MCVVGLLACGIAGAKGGVYSEKPPATFATSRPLLNTADMAAETVAGVDRFLLQALERSTVRRARYWHRDLSSAKAYDASVTPNRGRFARMIGIRDPGVPFDSPELIATAFPLSPVGQTPGFTAWAVRWPTLDGMTGEGLLLEPSRGRPVASVVAIPDCAQTPEMLVGLDEGIPRESQFARRLAENGCRVVVPMLIDRGNGLSRVAAGKRRSDVSHRELLYRSAYQMGRHLIGYEVQKVLAALGWLAKASGPDASPLGVIGYGEGGLLALYAGAIETRIDVVGVSGYFDSRQELWREPIDRNVFGLLDEFGDAEIGSLIAPRSLLLEACAVPTVDIPPGTNNAPGRLTTPPVELVRGEMARLAGMTDGLAPEPQTRLVVSQGGSGPYGTAPFVEAFLAGLRRPTVEPPGPIPKGHRADSDVDARKRRQFSEIRAYSERLIDESSDVRDAFMANLKTGGGVVAYAESVRPYRDILEEKVLGKLDHELSAPDPRSRLSYDTPEFLGYEVVLDVVPEVILYGILLVPKDIRPGERRPVVVCQHGLEGSAKDVVEGDRPSYRDFASRLARRGFITFAPQHLYRGGDRFRTLQRKANPLRMTLFSVMVAQHRQLLSWLGGLDMVDPKRIGFYGISYGGKSAMRIPAVLEGYCLSICSSDFSDWIWRTASGRHPHGYLAHNEYEIFEFDLGSTFNYAELASLICPRPFMAEEFHRYDTYTRRAAAEFGKIELLYESLGLADRAEWTTYPSPEAGTEYQHRKTFDFLQTHLRRPQK